MPHRRRPAPDALLIAFMAATLLAATPAQERPPREDHESGAYLYRTFCVSCHGDSGRGDGPVADLSPVRPTDLTTLSRANGDRFPRAAVRDALEGTRPIAGHGAPGMPNWREVLRRTARGDDAMVNAQLDALVSHVESLQRPGTR